jgi:hypothetical protein
MFQKWYVGSSAMIADEAPLSRRCWSGDVELEEEAQETSVSARKTRAFQLGSQQNNRPGETH